MTKEIKVDMFFSTFVYEHILIKKTKKNISPRYKIELKIINIKRINNDEALIQFEFKLRASMFYVELNGRFTLISNQMRIIFNVMSNKYIDVRNMQNNGVYNVLRKNTLARCLDYLKREFRMKTINVDKMIKDLKIKWIPGDYLDINDAKLEYEIKDNKENNYKKEL